jgi:hypothetical protein
MLVRASGGAVVFEPSAVVSQLLPRPFPFDAASRSFFLQRWNRADNRATIEHFRTKWCLQARDPALEATLEWLDARPDLRFRYLRPDIVRNGLRRVRRALRRAA